MLIVNRPSELKDLKNSPWNINETVLIGSFKLLKKLDTPFSTGSGAINLYVFTIGLIAISSIKKLKFNTALFIGSIGSYISSYEILYTETSSSEKLEFICKKLIEIIKRITFKCFFIT